jgi:hypothetical protein
MMIARWNIDARFGSKQIVIDAVKAWCRDVGAQIGWTPDKLRLLSGSVGAPESAVVLEVAVEDLAALNTAWTKLGSLAAHGEWSKRLEPNIVSGTNRWEVFRVV